jgi:hypothetical protein
LYVLHVAAGAQVTAWRPVVSGVTEVFHARFVDHVYPMHTHEAWTLLLIDAGAVRYDLDGHEHAALDSEVTLLPPHVPHDGQAATPYGFRKRVLFRPCIRPTPTSTSGRDRTALLAGSGHTPKPGRAEPDRLQ